NVLDANTGVHRFTSYKIIEKTFKDTRNESVMLKVGITGIVPPQILIWDKAYLEGRVKVEDSIVALNKILPEIKKAGADLVVVLSHSGI
ncbi:2',3'-cyclic-nucleotide 2'-phosphodiesterase, partial [Streptococcus danieliae]|nr:2',3'-cyclic-nucleotide 2'-phosphodiesterase [Streptococcus danieliae]